MQVSFERSGGFTGISITVTLDSASLSADEATHLHHLVDAADFFNLPTAIAGSAQPDRFQYRVSIQEHNQQHTVTVKESAIPDTLKPLLDWLLDAARKRK